jgi:hypothetical protein
LATTGWCGSNPFVTEADDRIRAQEQTQALVPAIGQGGVLTGSAVRAAASSNRNWREAADSVTTDSAARVAASGHD